MTKRFREPVEVLETRRDARGADGFVPVAFRWRGRIHHVNGVLGHWREDARWWVGGGVTVPQCDLWRLEIVGGNPIVCELVQEDGSWRVDRIWD